MSILIKGMEMPKRCFECYLVCAGEDGLWCLVTDKNLRKEHGIKQTRPDWCPLVPVPPHGRLIDANKIGLTNFEIILCQKGNPFKNALEMLLEKIENVPTIIEAEEEKNDGNNN